MENEILKRNTVKEEQLFLRGIVSLHHLFQVYLIF